MGAIVGIAIITALAVPGVLNAIGVVADPLFTRYLLAFELTSVLLLIAIVGAVALGRRGDVAVEPLETGAGQPASSEESARAG